MLYTFRLWSPLIKGFLFPKPRTAEVKIAYLCTPIDIDFNGHLNASVYNIFCDAGRRHLIKNLGLVRIMVKQRWAPIVVDARIRFYKEIPLWRVFTVTTRIICTYEKSFIIESRFESRGVLHCVALEMGFFLKKGGRVRRSQLVQFLPEFLAKQLPPEIPQDVKNLDPYLFELISQSKRSSPLLPSISEETLSKLPQDDFDTGASSSALPTI